VAEPGLGAGTLRGLSGHRGSRPAHLRPGPPLQPRARCRTAGAEWGHL